jgi:hypothetical protein
MFDTRTIASTPLILETSDEDEDEDEVFVYGELRSTEQRRACGAVGNHGVAHGGASLDEYDDDPKHVSCVSTAGTDGDKQVYRSLGGAATSSDVNEDDGWGSGDPMEEYTDSGDEFVKAGKVKTKAEWTKWIEQRHQQTEGVLEKLASVDIQPRPYLTVDKLRIVKSELQSIIEYLHQQSAPVLNDLLSRRWRSSACFWAILLTQNSHAHTYGWVADTDATATLWGVKAIHEQLLLFRSDMRPGRRHGREPHDARGAQQLVSELQPHRRLCIKDLAKRKQHEHAKAFANLCASCNISFDQSVAKLDIPATRAVVDPHLARAPLTSTQTGARPQPLLAHLYAVASICGSTTSVALRQTHRP